MHSSIIQTMVVVAVSLAWSACLAGVYLLQSEVANDVGGRSVRDVA